MKKIKGYYLGAAVFFSTALFVMSKLEYCGSVWGDTNSNFIDTSLNITDSFFLIVPLLIYVLLMLIDKFMNKYKIKPTEYSEKTKSKLMIIWSIIIFFVWACYFLTYYPGGIYSDTFSSIDMAINRNILQNHHPILYTWLIQLAINFGMDIMGKDMTWSLGLFLLIQMIFMGATVIAFLNWSLNKKLSKLFINLSMVYLVFFPLIPLYGISVWKDTPFCIALFYYALCIVDLFYEDKKVKYGIILFITSLLVAFTRNNGIYIIAGTNIILAIYGFVKKRNRYICIFGLIVVLMCGVVQGPIYKVIGVSQTEFVENLGIPIQQIGYTVASDGTMSDEEKEEISKFIPCDLLKASYVPCLVDSIKWSGGFDYGYLEENKMQFFNLWLRLLKQNPDKYVYAYLIGTCGFWALNVSGFDAYVQNYVWPNGYGVEHVDLFQKYTGFSLYDLLNPKKALSSAIFFWILFFCIIICIQRNSLRYIIPFLPSLLIWMTIMVATPIAVSMRYAFGLVFLLPIFFATLAMAERKEPL